MYYTVYSLACADCVYCVAPGIITPGSSENPAIIWDTTGRDPALDHLAETIIMMVEAVALSVKHSNNQLKL